MGWNDERVSFITTQFRDAQTPIRQIAAMLGDTTPGAVAGKLSRLGIRRPQVRRIRQLPGGKDNSVRNPQPSKTPREKLPRSVFLRSLPPVELTEVTTEVALLATEPHHCRWIEGKMAGAAYVCGRPKFPGYSFCEHHAAIVYQPGGGRSRRAK